MSDATPQLTEQQRRALGTRDVSVALSAGAGCGKTFVLTRRFLDALHPRHGKPRVSGIVAITFTDRAAREMRDRIRAACAAELHRAGADDRRHWQSVARDIESARIGTIHSFCAGILRTYAVEAGVDPEFAVGEENTARTLLRRTVTDTVHRLLTDHDDDCMEFVLHFGLERTIDLLIALTQGRFHGRTTPVEELDVETRGRAWLELWNGTFVPQLLHELQESPAARHVIELLDEHVPRHKEMSRRRDLLRQTLPNLVAAPDSPAGATGESSAGAERPSDSKIILENCRNATLVRGGGGKSVWSDEEVYQQVKSALETLRKAIDKTLEKLAIPEDDVRAAAEFSVLAERLLQPVLEEFEDRKSQTGLLDFDDLLLGARQLLRSSESVRRRVAAGIDFLMIDEFQDTDPVQADIVRDICGEKLLSGKLFLVGDVKQSIYRFRRADPRVFEGLRQEIPEAGRLPLSRNFRSQPAILNFVNALFAKSMGDDYEPLVPNVEQLSPTPSIEFLFATQPPGDGPADDAEDRRRREADWLARRIRSLLDDDTPRIREAGTGRLRRAQPGDFAVLFRTLSNVAIYEDALRRHGIGYYLVGGRAFFAQQEVYDLMNLCSVLDDPDDEVALVGVLRSPMFGLTDETLFAMGDAFASLGDALANADRLAIDGDQRRQVAFAAEVLGDMRARKDRLPLAELLESFLDRTGYDAVLLTEFLGRRKLANLRKLVEMAREFDRTGLMTLAEFVQRLRESVLEQSREQLAALHAESSDVVRLMTVHQSKGLEFPVVAVADMDWYVRGGTSGTHFHPQLGPLFSLPTDRGRRRRNLGQMMYELEERDENARENDRLLYVAATRAADHLIFSAGLPEHGRPSSPWLKLVGECFNLQTGLPAVDPYLGTFALGNIDPEKIPEILVHHQRPAVTQKTTSTEKSLPLSEFRDAVRDAALEPVPRLTERIAPATGGAIEVTVSEILAADRLLRASAHPTATSRQENSEDDVDRSLLGTVIHQVIERLDDAARVEAVMASVFNESNADDDLREAVARRVGLFLESDECRAILAADPCHRELDFVLRKGHEDSTVLIHGQIDCLYQTPDGRWHLVDFKTGKRHADDPAALLDSYAVQLSLYAEAAATLLGRFPDEVAIVHVGDAIRRVALSLEQITGAALDDRIRAALAGAAEAR